MIPSAMPESPVGFVLASASPARASTLRAAGIEPYISVSKTDEDSVLEALFADAARSGTPAAPSDQVVALARAKAEAVALDLLTQIGQRTGFSHERLLIVGCDSMLELDGQMLGKPHQPEVAFERIKEFQGRSATLWTGHHMILFDGRAPVATLDHRPSKSAAASTVIQMGEMSDSEISAYVASGEPLEVAGSFTIDGLGGAFIEGVVGDPHSVVGISLPLLRKLAQELGVFWPALWA